MGTDILNYSGVIASTYDMMGFVNGKNRKKVIEVCQKFYDEQVKLAAEEPDNTYRKERVEFFKSLDKIKVKTLPELKAILTNLVQVEGDEDAGDDVSVRHSYQLKELWDGILETYDKLLPNFSGIEVWGSSRLNGYDVPICEACFVFDDNSCYIKQLSEIGKNLKKAIGHCDAVSWTVLSC